MNNAAVEKPAPEPAQGITGKVVALKGNFMPGPGPTSGTREPLSVPVHVFKGQIEIIGKPDVKHPALVRIVKSDKHGEYRVGLEPGQYTVVAEIDGRLYLNIMQMDPKTRKPVWPMVKVEPGKWTAWTIEDTSQAAF